MGMGGWLYVEEIVQRWKVYKHLVTHSTLLIDFHCKHLDDFRHEIRPRDMWKGLNLYNVFLGGKGWWEVKRKLKYKMLSQGTSVHYI